MLRLVRVARARRRLRAAASLATRGELATAAGCVRAATAVLAREVGRPGGPAGIELVAALRDLAQIELARVDLAAALEALDDALALLSRLESSAAGVEHRAWRCDLLTRRGNARRLRGEHHPARADLAAALATATDPVVRAGVCNALGILAKDMDELDAAERWYAEAQKVLGDTSADPVARATLLHNLAGIAYARGRFAEGESHIRRALDLRPTAGSDAERAAVLGDRGVLAALLAGQGRDDEAEALWRDLVDRWTALRGGEHYEVGHARHHLGLLLARRGDRDAGAAELRTALRVLAAVLGDAHPEVAAVAGDLAMVTDPRPPPV